MPQLGPKQATNIGNATAIEICNFLQHDHGVEMTHATTADRAVEIHPEIAEFAIATAQGEIHWFIVNLNLSSNVRQLLLRKFSDRLLERALLFCQVKSMIWSVLVMGGQSGPVSSRRLIVMHGGSEPKAADICRSGACS